MTDRPLDGCRTEPLGSYLQGLGAWRAVVRTTDPTALARWEGGRLVLTTDADPVTALMHGYEPLPIVSPWNEGSGFAGNGKSPAAERVLQRARTHEDPRFARLRVAVEAGDAIVRQGRDLNWGSTTGGLWDPKRKADVLALSRNRLPDDALRWLDVAAVLGQDDEPAFNRLLGTGGNFGRLDLSKSYIHTVLLLLDPARAEASERWLRAALAGDETVPYLRESVGQFDPGRAGGIQSSPLEKADDEGFSNPWSLVLTLEGTLLFASAVVRRLGAKSSRASIPFVVRATAAAFGSTAEGENAMAEMWTPEWDRPATLGEIEHLLAEGRLEWGGTTVRSGLDVVRAIASVGVDRGVTSFSRHVFVERHGQSPLAVPVGRFRVPDRPGKVGMLTEVDGWLRSFRGVRSDAVERGRRLVERAMFEVGAAPGSIALRRLLIELGRLHRAVARSGSSRATIRPLLIRRPKEWWDALEVSDEPELRIAAAYASARDWSGAPGSRSDEGGPSEARADVDASEVIPGGRGGHVATTGDLTVRALLSPVRRRGRQVEWTGRPASVVSGAGVVERLAAVHRQRAVPGALVDVVGSASAEPPAVRGVFTAYNRGSTVGVADVVRVAEGGLDDALLEDYLEGLMLFDWAAWQPPRSSAVPERAVLSPVLGILLPFFASRPLEVRAADDGQALLTPTLRPGAEWLPLLGAGRIADVTTDAAHRLRLSGFAHAVEPQGSGAYDGARVSAALLLRVSQGHRAGALRAVTVAPELSAEQAQDHDEGVLA